MSYRGTRNGKRFRRARRRGRMTAAEATRRTRWDLWLVTKYITRWHRQRWTWSDDWNGD